MKIIILIMSFVMLLLNLYGYKNYFCSSKKATKDLKEAFNKIEDEYKEIAKGASIILLLFITLFCTVFYITSGTIIGTNLIILIAVFLVIRIWIAFFKSAKGIVDLEVNHSAFGYIVAPLSTAYIIYFIYTYLGF